MEKVIAGDFCMSKKGNTTAIQELKASKSGDICWDKGQKFPNSHLSAISVKVPAEKLVVELRLTACSDVIGR